MNKKKQPRKRNPASLNKALAQIEQMLLRAPYRNELWDVLTALRGPDNDDVGHKESTTIHIRRKAFPLLAAQYDMGRSRGRFSTMGLTKPSFYSREYKGKFDSNGSHFSNHINSAAIALGLV